MLGWGGFSEKARRARTSPLLRLAAGETALHPSVTFTEDRAAGFAPLFTAEGFSKAERVTLVEGGRWRDALVSPRTAKEFAITPNSGREHPESFAMSAGDVPQAEIARRLGTGLWIENLWYCNYSDRNACRITGMTRFACFWVEDGEIVAPLPAMRFDDTLYGLLGERLIGITRERELLLSSSTYGGRATASSLLPGILVEDLALTL
jgi:predicted Zn-dependent protease